MKKQKKKTCGKRRFRCIVCQMAWPGMRSNSPCKGCTRIMRELNAVHHYRPKAIPRILRPIRCYGEGES